MKRTILGAFLPLLLFSVIHTAHAADTPKPSTSAAAPAMTEFDVKKAIASGDHVGLAKYYKEQAEIYRQKAASHENMHKDYKTSHVHYKGMENNFAAHCSILKENALKTAKNYDELAEQEEKLAGMPEKK